MGKLSRFIMPYPQEALGGEFGLTSQDLAEVLGTNAGSVRRKIERSDISRWKSKGWDLVTYVINTGKRGRTGTGYVLNTAATKVILARWKSKLGDDYLQYLLQCEKAVEIGIPKLQAELDKAADEFKLEQQSRKKLEMENQAMKQALAKKKRRSKLVNIITNTTIEHDMFGLPYTKIKYIEKRYDELTENELSKEKIMHRAKTMKGLANIQESAINRDHDNKIRAIKSKRQTNVVAIREKA